MARFMSPRACCKACKAISFGKPMSTICATASSGILAQSMSPSESSSRDAGPDSLTAMSEITSKSSSAGAEVEVGNVAPAKVYSGLLPTSPAEKTPTASKPWLPLGSEGAAGGSGAARGAGAATGGIAESLAMLPPPSHSEALPLLSSTVRRVARKASLSCCEGFLARAGLREVSTRVFQSNHLAAIACSTEKPLAPLPPCSKMS
mmetsp:Transcript_76622/g.212924  ORF Transcript_76622/g.212924 Transcript_76622/m.212924 type:complete len:205 (+) Transcript_76622:162-776(+)